MTKKFCVDCGQPTQGIRCQECRWKLTVSSHRERSRQWHKAYILRKGNKCLDCGEPIHPQRKRCRHCNMKYQVGEKAHNWKGGRVSHGKIGYVRLLKPGHHRATKKGYVFEHIFLWEEANQKSLPIGWVIHHLNGIKYDNRLVNLVALPDKKHYLVLQAKAKRIQELEALLNGQQQLI